MKNQAMNRVRTSGAVREGEIKSNTIPYLFHELCAGKATGVLTVTENESRKSVQLAAGRVRFASSNERDDRFNQILLAADVLPLKDLLKALEVSVVTKDRLGEVMVRYKMLTPEDIEKWINVQVREIVYTIFQWTRGRYSFETKGPSSESITIDVSGDAMVVEGVRRITSWARVYEEVGGLNTEYRTTKDMPAIVRELPLRAEEKKLLEVCDTPLSLGEICEASELSDHDICKSIWALLIVGALMKA
jgi:uncharacterized protein DUF4388